MVVTAAPADSTAVEGRVVEIYPQAKQSSIMLRLQEPLGKAVASLIARKCVWCVGRIFHRVPQYSYQKNRNVFDAIRRVRSAGLTPRNLAFMQKTKRNPSPFALPHASLATFFHVRPVANP